MPVKYCLPIIAKSTANCREQIAAAKDYDFYEIWLDYLEDPEEALSLADVFPGKIIYLFRRLKLEGALLEFSKQESLLAALQNKNCLIDLDVKNQKDLLKSFSREKRKEQLLLSFHDYDATPTAEQLDELLLEMKVIEPVIFKFACFCNSQEDTLRLFTLQQKLKTQNAKHIVLGMGKNGLATRIFGTLWGNEMIFAPLQRDAATAPEQLTKSELQSIFNILNSN